MIALFVTWRGPCRASRWRVVSLLLALVMFLSSFQHLACLADESFNPETIGWISSPKQSVPPVTNDQCVAIHCHCTCHGAVRTWIDAPFNPAADYRAAFGFGEDRLLRSLTALPPFKPPRA